MSFGFLNHLGEMDAENSNAAAEELAKVYKGELEPSLGNEFVEFVFLINLYKKDNDKDPSKKLF